jgi:two-component system sensor histidine kinase PilS (NtrC family)
VVEGPGTTQPILAGGGQDLARKLSWYMAMRVGIVTLLLGGTVALNLGSLADLDQPTPRFLLAVVAATYAATLGYGLVHRRVGGEPWFARLQLATDLVAWTAVVYASGGPLSGFTFLYGVEVTVAAILLGRGAAFWSTGVSALLFSVLVGLLWLGVLAPLPDQQVRLERTDPSEYAFALLLNGTAMLLIANLSGYLAARLQRAGGALREAETRRADLEARFEDIVRSLESGLLTVDTGWIVRSANPTACHLLDCLEPNVLGQPLAAVLGRLATEVRGEGRGEGTYVRPDGTELPLGYTVSPLLDSRGKESGHLILFQDLSERQRLRHEVEVAEHFAALGRLAAGLAHEIRNPLGSISGSVEMLRDTPALAAEDRQLADLVLRETARLNDLVTDILLFARPRPPVLEVVGVGRLLGEVLEMFRRGPAGERVVVRGEIEEDLQARVDPDQLRQVLWNLLKNAADASPGGGEVTVTTMRGDGDALIIEVRDRGRGIPEEVRGRIFDPFYSSRAEGLGIGLALVRQITEAHGGKVEVDSRPAEGATFRIILPNARASASPKAVADGTARRV